MAITNYDLLQLGLEQGSIGSSGNTEDSSKVRSVGYIEISAFSRYATLSATSSTGKSVLVDFIGYSSKDASAIVCDLYWYGSPYKFDITSYSGIKYFRVVLKYSDGSTFLPSEVATANAEIEYPPPWYAEDNRLTHIELPEPLMGKYISEPYPPFMWYVDENRLKRSNLPERVNLGAFADCTNLRRVIIPPSVKYIGEYAFANTALTSVTIARDCEFFPTSFPPRCIINYYN
jgi:hypothetical protein